MNNSIDVSAERATKRRRTVIWLLILLALLAIAAVITVIIVLILLCQQKTPTSSRSTITAKSTTTTTTTTTEMISTETTAQMISTETTTQMISTEMMSTETTTQMISTETTTQMISTEMMSTETTTQMISTETTTQMISTETTTQIISTEIMSTEITTTTTTTTEMMSTETTTQIISTETTTQMISTEIMSTETTTQIISTETTTQVISTEIMSTETTTQMMSTETTTEMMPTETTTQMISTETTTETTTDNTVSDQNTNCVFPFEQSPSGDCVNILIDFNNCGTIGNVCPDNYTSCSAGLCSTAPSIELNNPIPIFTAALNGSVDDEFYNIIVPFSITLYNTTTNFVQVTTNGVLCLGNCSRNYTETVLPTSAFSGATAFPYWDDLYIYENTSQGIYYQTAGNAPNRTLIFEYYCSHYRQPIEYYHFQVVFFEDMPGVVKYVYYDVSDRGANCTVGVQGSSRGPFMQHSFHQINSVTKNLTLTFDTNAEVYTNSSLI